ncbi:hypothetical protein K437DRAFT_273311 [Tilletiaria anomala UBC 951]|uniref:peptidylprolyl isomerase n=1 Tax=Tilletiaria anomala (strain ATCC 24038 / CBS 436.72 / UBC 951) TaxID=1037660 RepID=A0A066W674_TILAU|nr:uncharacterized protein K437DRAFT_273311 [Tilletiaria anomala UBC 951]KDN49241.1 hypothetical protein K437DRAFT_273311 [Tilletiaria anomala UBC 951]
MVSTSPFSSLRLLQLPASGAAGKGCTQTQILTALRPLHALRPRPTSPLPYHHIFPSKSPCYLSLSLQCTRLFSSTRHALGKQGVQIERISPGDNASFPKKGDKVSMHYVGTLSNGNKFDSSRDRGRPFETVIGVGQVIKGWDEGVPQLSLGEKANLICSPDFAYGAGGYPPIIPPNSTLNFEVELLAINGKKA